MVMTEFFLLALSIIVGMLGYFLTQLSSDIKEIQRTIHEMPKEYLLKTDYALDIHEMKDELKEQRKLIDQIWKTLREKN